MEVDELYRSRPASEAGAVGHPVVMKIVVSVGVLIDNVHQPAVLHLLTDIDGGVIDRARSRVVVVDEITGHQSGLRRSQRVKCGTRGHRGSTYNIAAATVDDEVTVRLRHRPCVGAIVPGEMDAIVVVPVVSISAVPIIDTVADVL